MLTLFRTNQLLLSVLLLAYAAVLRIAYFQLPLIEVSAEPGIGNFWLTSYTSAPSSSIFIVIICLLSLQAFIANKIFFEHRLHRDLTLFSGVFIILIGSILPDFLSYSSFLPANLFLLLALREVLKVYRTSSAADIIFNAGFFIGMACLFQPAYVVFLLAIGFAVVNLKSGKFRDQFILWAGTAVPLFLIGVYYYFNDQLSVFWAQQWSGAFSIPSFSGWQHIPIPYLVVMGGLLLAVVLGYQIILAKSKMEIRIKINTIYWFLGGSCFYLLISAEWQNYQFQALVPALGFLLGIYFTKTKPVTAEIWHLVLLALLFVFHFGNSLGYGVL